MDVPEGVASARGLEPGDAATARRLVRLWELKKPRNDLRESYYLSHEPVRDIGIAIPPEVLSRLRTRVDWPRKAVHALANRSQFDGYASTDEDTQRALAAVCDANRMRSLYRKNLIGQLKHCCSFWEVMGGEGDAPVVSAYPATAACALWDDGLKRIAAGLVVVESRHRDGAATREPTVLRMHLPDSVVTLRRGRGGWSAEYAGHSMGRPLMEPMPFEPTLERPFGHSRISRAVMSITDDAVREKARSEVAAECSALPQIWLIGTASAVVTDANRFSAAMNRVNEVTKDEDGDKPDVWQSSQLTMQPHIDYMRSLACQFSGATNVPLSELGVVSDNPSSAEAIYAAKESLVIDAQNLNADNAEALKNVALMALAVLRGTDYATERAADAAIMPRFRNPAMPSVVSQSSAMVQQVSAIPWLADTEVALEELGYTEDQIRRMQADRRRSQGRALAYADSGAEPGANVITTALTRGDTGAGDGALKGGA